MNPRSFSLTEVAEPSCARLGAGHDEDGRGGDLCTLAGPDVLERPGCQAGLAVAVRNSGAEPDSDFGVAFSWVMRRPDMLAASDSPRTSTVTRVANLARCRAA